MGKFSLVSHQNVAKTLCIREQDVLSAQVDYRSQFYKHYRKEAGEYDREFMEKYDEDLNTTLIFVSSVWCSGVRVLTLPQAGLFSAVTSAFIIDVQSELRSDPNDETAALLRVLIYKTDNTTFGNDIPPLPQWTGPPQMIVQVQAVLYASLTVSLLSAFLAMLGKQWLNRYASTDLRGTAIERSQNRQRKLDGIITWYFDHVMESLPLMLQAALLLLGCALSRYLWEINTAVASVLIGVTSLGMIFYIFIVIAGAASESCPYQTPGSTALRYADPKVKGMLHSVTTVATSAASAVLLVFKKARRNSETIRIVKRGVSWEGRRQSGGNIIHFLGVMIREIPRAVAIDIYHLGRTIILPLAALPAEVCRLGSVTITLSVSLARRVYNWLRGASSPPEQALDLHTTMLDFRCISWMLQTSLDKTIHLATFKHIVTTTTLTGFYPILVTDCLDAFIGCLKGGVANREVVIVQGLEELATVSALCFFNIFSHLLAVDPTSSVLEGARQRCLDVISPDADFRHQYHTMNAIRSLLVSWDEWRQAAFSWEYYKPSTHEHSMVAQSLVRLARFKYQTTQDGRVPVLILHFTFHSLSLYPPPPTPVIAGCLSIIAIDLGCDVSDTGTTTPDER